MLKLNLKILVYSAVLTSLFLLGFTSPIEKKLAFTYATNDGVLLEIYGIYSNQDELESYTSRIQTPVCKNNQCNEVELDFYWDLLGNFTEFRLLSGKPLTKLDHIPFSTTDYEKLQTILLNPSPSFMHLRKSQLLASDPSDNAKEVDAISGATSEYLKESMIEGAIYTCFTLWHIANGDIHFQMQEYTKQNLNESLIGILLKSERVEMHYFLIENLEPKYFGLFLNEFISLTENADKFLVNRFIQKMPEDLLEDSIAQDFVVKSFDQLDKYSGMEFFKKIDIHKISLTDTTLRFFIRSLEQNDEVKNDFIIKIVTERANASNISLLKSLFEVLINQRISVSKTSSELLMSLGQQYSSLKKVSKKLRNRN